jgi:hypothetical protein
MGYAGGGINGSLRWRDLGLDDLLPVDEEKEEAKRAMLARKMASGANNNPQAQQVQNPAQAQLDQLNEDEDEDHEDDDDDDDDDDEDEDENDENNIDEDGEEEGEGEESEGNDE